MIIQSYWCVTTIGLGHDHLATIVAAEDINHVVPGRGDIVVGVTHAPTLVAGQGHHDDHIHTHVVHHHIIGDARHFHCLNNVTKHLVIICSTPHLFS